MVAVLFSKWQDYNTAKLTPSNHISYGMGIAMSFGVIIVTPTSALLRALIFLQETLLVYL